MNSSDYSHIDDTGGRHKGVNYHAHVICGALFTVFFILPKKGRETLRGILGLNEGEKRMMKRDNLRLIIIKGEVEI